MKTLENIKKELNVTLTENLDIAYKSTFDKNLDLFGLMGAMRYNSDDFMTLFIRAYNENQELAIRNLFYLRDVRGGMGERNNFRLGIKWLSENYPNKLINIINEIPEVGRWDDILLLLENPKTKEKTVQLISKQLDEDLNSQNPSLMAKWLPSINTSSFEMRKLALFLCRELGMSNKEYRKTLSTLRKQIGVLERKLSKKEYDFDYAKVPSQAMHKYRQAFNRNDEKRYLEYISDLSKGETKINVGTLYPHQIISKYYKSIINWKAKNIEEYEIKLMEEQWKAMERVETEVNTIVVRDGSGSMWGTPLEIATALAILYSEQLKGEFKDKFITFSSNPELVSLENCKTLQDKLNEVNTYGDCSNTNIELVYNLILKSSINVPEEEQIDKVLIISDMEFDGGWQGDLDIEMSRYDKIKRKYIELNIKMPEIVFWNVNARKIHFPTTDKDNVKLISGYSNYVLQDILKDTTTDPIEFMIETLKKYKDISNKYLL